MSDFGAYRREDDGRWALPDSAVYRCSLSGVIARIVPTVPSVLPVDGDRGGDLGFSVGKEGVAWA